MVAMGMTTLLSILAIVLAVSAVATKSPSPSPASQSANSASSNNGMNANMGTGANTNMTATGSSTTSQTDSTPAASGPVQDVKLIVKSDDEHGKMGPDGKWHDAFLPASFSVHAGDTVQVTVYNYDEGAHSFTSTSLSSTEVVDQQIPAGSEKTPSKTVFTFTAPTKPGKYLWWCDQPCDPWAMKHIGYMRGYVTVVA